MESEGKKDHMDTIKIAVNIDTLNKMQLVTEASKAFGLGRNDCLRFTVDSLKAALRANDKSLLVAPNAVPTPQGAEVILGEIRDLLKQMVSTNPKV